MITQKLDNIIPELKTIISTEFKRFKQPDRILVDNEITNNNLGYDDLLFLKPRNTQDPQLLSVGKLDTYNLTLVYLKKVHKNEVSVITEFYEALDELLTNNAYSDYWYQMNQSIEYDESIEDYLPEDYTELKGKFSGFVMTLEIKVGKF